MLDQLLKAADGPLQEMLAGMNQDNPGETASALESSLGSILQNKVASGDTSALMEMFSGKETSAGSSIVQALQGDVASDLIGKLGISKEQAASLTAVAIPFVMNFFNNKVDGAPQANEDIMSSVISALQGKQGKVDAGDLAGALLGGGGKGGMDLGGLMDMGKGLFK